MAQDLAPRFSEKREASHILPSRNYSHLSVFAHSLPLCQMKRISGSLLLSSLSFPLFPRIARWAHVRKPSLVSTLELQTCFFLPSVTQHLDNYFYTGGLYFHTHVMLKNLTSCLGFKATEASICEVLLCYATSYGPASLPKHSVFPDWNAREALHTPTLWEFSVVACYLQRRVRLLSPRRISGLSRLTSTSLASCTCWFHAPFQPNKRTLPVPLLLHVTMPGFSLCLPLISDLPFFWTVQMKWLI